MGTTELMLRFHRQTLKEGLRLTATLRAAQISLMKETRWASPFYWAPFTLRASGNETGALAGDRVNSLSLFLRSNPKNPVTRCHAEGST